jgi:hypothetical protein
MHAEQHGFGNGNLAKTPLAPRLGPLYLQNARFVPKPANNALYGPVPHRSDFSGAIMRLECRHTSQPSALSRVRLFDFFLAFDFCEW